MRSLVVLSTGSTEDDFLVEAAVSVARDDDALVLLSVLPGALVGHLASPADRGRQRRAHEDRAIQDLAAQLARTGCDARTVALFGDPVDDLILLAANLGADAVVVSAAMPDLPRLTHESPCPVIVVPQAEAPA